MESSLAWVYRDWTELPLSDTLADVRLGLNILLLYTGFAIPNLERELGAGFPVIGPP